MSLTDEHPIVIHTDPKGDSPLGFAAEALTKESIAQIDALVRDRLKTMDPLALPPACTCSHLDWNHTPVYADHTDPLTPRSWGACVNKNCKCPKFEGKAA